MSNIYQQLGIIHWVTKHKHPATTSNINLMIVTVPSDEDNVETEQLLTAMLKAINLTRDDVHIASAEQCNSTQPRLMLAMGEAAAQALLGSTSSLESLRGKMHHCGEAQTPLIVTYHPSHLLRNPADKKKAFMDLKFVKSQL